MPYTTATIINLILALSVVVVVCRKGGVAP